jgi:hypothetical protein
MIKTIKNFFTKSYFCISPIMPKKKSEYNSFEAIWLNIAKDFNTSFSKKKEKHDERN